MIAVIADDFTGAAEIGGIGLRHGLKVIIETSVEKAEDCDLLIIATDTRSMTSGEAVDEIRTITKKLLDLNPFMIFKKLDSVLRGHIACELEAQMKIMDMKRSVIVAGNPNFKRLIINGQYTIQDVPLKETFFANDPEFPVLSSAVTDIIKSDSIKVENVKACNELPDCGLIVGDVCCEEDLSKWADLIDENTIAAGGSGFFNVILKKYFPTEQPYGTSSVFMHKKSLFVFGSMFPKSDVLLRQMADSNVSPINMPEEIFKSESNNYKLIDQWADEINVSLAQGDKVVVTVNHSDNSGNGISTRVKENLGLLVGNIFKKTEIKDLLIEGGATTSVILKKLNITKLHPFQEIDFGIIQMKVDNYPELCITTKPGSYSWPDNVWITNTNKN